MNATTTYAISQSKVSPLLGTSLLQAAGTAKYPQVVQILRNHALNPTSSKEWFGLQGTLAALSDIKRAVGFQTLFMAGKKKAEMLNFGPMTYSLEAVLTNLDNVYRQNHIGEAVGYYKLVSYSKALGRAVVESRSIYDDSFDRGLLIGLGRRFKPMGAQMVECVVDNRMPSRKDGFPSTSFMIQWH